MLSVNEGCVLTFLLLQSGPPLRGFSKVRTITTTINTKIPHSVPTGALEFNIFIGHSLTDFKSLQQSYWEEKSLCLCGSRNLQTSQKCHSDNSTIY